MRNYRKQNDDSARQSVVPLAPILKLDVACTPRMLVALSTSTQCKNSTITLHESLRPVNAELKRTHLQSFQTGS
jgi:hypothetical protein